MALGAEIGHDWPAVGRSARLLSQIFLRLIKTIIAPLLFATLVVGIAGHSNLRQVGRMGIKALLYFEIVTTIALFLGLAAINLSRAGVGVTPPAIADSAGVTAKPQTAAEAILHAFPENVAKAVAEGHVLQIVVFSILFAIALALVSESKRQPVLVFCEGLAEVMFKFTKLVMYFAPSASGRDRLPVGPWGSESWCTLQAVATLYVALTSFSCSSYAHRAHRARAAAAVHAGDRRAGVNRLRDHELRGALPLAMQRMEIGCAAADRGVCDAHGYSFIHGFHVVLAGHDLRRPGGRDRPLVRPQLASSSH